MNDPQRRDRPSPPDGEAAVPPGPSAETQEALLTPAEVAALFRVDPKTVTRWAVAGKLDSLRTLGGHRRYRAAEVHALLADVRDLHSLQQVPARVVGHDALLGVADREPHQAPSRGPVEVERVAPFP